MKKNQNFFKMDWKILLTACILLDRFMFGGVCAFGHDGEFDDQEMAGIVVRVKPEDAKRQALAGDLRRQLDEAKLASARLEAENRALRASADRSRHELIELTKMYQVQNGQYRRLQLVLSGAGDMQIDVLVAKLKSRFGVDAELFPAKIAYREKIKKTVEAHGRHKKQTGGSGQFGDVWVRFEPQDEQDELIFAEEVFGGSVPRNFYPAVEKGLQEAVQKGPLAGYPMVGLKAVLYDGSYHPVDSNEMAFKLAAILAYKEAMPKANPTLLEPVGSLAVTVPEDYVGDVMGDLSKRRGRPMGMNPDSDGNTVIEAEVPMAEMSSYAIDLRAMTQARGSFTLTFERYEEVPKQNQAKIIADAKNDD